MRPRFGADVMQRTIEAVHEPRWEELIRRRPSTERMDLATGSHDAHLDASDEWIDALRGWLLRAGDRTAIC